MKSEEILNPKDICRYVLKSGSHLESMGINKFEMKFDIIKIYLLFYLTFMSLNGTYTSKGPKRNRSTSENEPLSHPIFLSKLTILFSLFH